MPAQGPKPASQNRATWAYFGLVVGSAVVGETIALPLRLAPKLGGPEQNVPLNPLASTLQLFATHELQWSDQAWAVTGGLGATACLACAAGTWGWSWLRSSRRRRQEIDVVAQWMGHGERIDGLKAPAARAKAEQLGVVLPDEDSPAGVPIGQTLPMSPFGRIEQLVGSFEDLQIDIWGPRQGKSTSRVIPAIMQAIGPVLTTSNKRDVYDATRLYRDTKGTVWCFDPQAVAGTDTADFYWDPIEWIRNGKSLKWMEIRAAKLAGHFRAADDSGPQESGFFPDEAENLVTALLLAAVVGERPITQVYSWSANGKSEEPRRLLEKDPEFSMYADELGAQYSAADKQKDGVFATAKKMLSCLKLASIRPWVTAPADGEPPRKAFDADAFADATTACDTLYALSLEGEGSAAAIVTALTAAVVEGGMEIGSRSAGGRLPVPLLAVLDEAANVVRWRTLPKLYSHFGSRGIIVMTVLQSWAQGERCWGRDGMEALWSAATIKVVGSGVDNVEFLRGRSDVIGPRWEQTTSVTTGPGGQSQSTSMTQIPIMSVSDLATLPRGRAVLFAAGYPSVLFAPKPWMADHYSQWVIDSLAKYDPANTAPVSAAPATAKKRMWVVREPVLTTDTDTDTEGKIA